MRVLAAGKDALRTTALHVPPGYPPGEVHEAHSPSGSSAAVVGIACSSFAHSDNAPIKASWSLSRWPDRCVLGPRMGFVARAVVCWGLCRCRCVRIGLR